MTRPPLQGHALAILNAALTAADAAEAVKFHLRLSGNTLSAGTLRLPLKDFDRIVLVAAGKAAAPMSAAVKKIMGARLTSALAITKHGHSGKKLPGIEVFEAGHPIPDEAGLLAARKVESMLRELNARDLLLVAISGGASALLSAPAPGITLAAKQKTTGLLLRAGADIFELNAVRKHLSSLKGGRLAALAYPATVVSLLLSDVVGDPLDCIGSGPTAPDSTTFADALTVLDKYALRERVPASVRKHLEAAVQETPKPGDPLFANVHNILVGSNRQALEAAAAKAKSLGYRPLILSSRIQGETKEVARVHAAILLDAAPGMCILSGGETTVTVKGKGKGGRNQEFGLALALDIVGVANVAALCAGTDGTDGPTDAAGALVTGATITNIETALKHLRNNDSYPLLEDLGALIKTGPTGTNVMDINIMLCAQKS
jgi:hydroxypyruvate reductase